MENETGKTISVLSYEHDHSRDPYTLEALGEEFEIDVPPENVLMAVCAHHQAVELQKNNVEVSIMTVGGAAESNAKILEKINEITDTDVPIIPNKESNSVASNLESLSKENGPFVIICQKFAKLRTYIHSKYHLGKGNFELKDWEAYTSKNEFSDFENKLVSELRTLNHVPLQRKLMEGVLTVLAYIDPKNGMTTAIAGLRKKLREENPEDNPFNKMGLS